MGPHKKAAQLTSPKQRFLWYSDNDLINEDGANRKFADTQMIFRRILAMYMRPSLDIVGFGKSFDDKSYLDDLLSVPDLAAGVVQDLLAWKQTGEDIPGGEGKIAVMKWIASPPKFLSKITLQITRTLDGRIGTGIVELSPNW